MGKNKQQGSHRSIGPWERRFYGLLGILMLLLAGIGAILPVMPTTIFVILAAACFGRASPRWEAYLLQHPKYGPSLVAWREEGAISRKGKGFAVAGITFGLVIFWMCSKPSWWLGTLVTIFMVGSAIWLLTRPLPKSSSPSS
jgi:uncharacterized membrane protein YbaN (DUF454 family)